jgi:hypothetical protein
MKYYKALLVLFLFIILLLTDYWIHITFFKVDVVLYSSIADGVLATIVAGAILFGWGFFRLFNSFEKLLLTLIIFLIGYIFAISVPTVIDRSLSFYILEKIQQRGGGIRFDRFQDVFTKEYVKEHRLVDVRLTEQQASGTITIENGCVKLTDRGRQLATFSRFFRQHFLPKQRLLMGHYSDDLTNPFRNSANITGYECQ